MPEMEACRYEKKSKVRPKDWHRKHAETRTKLAQEFTQPHSTGRHVAGVAQRPDSLYTQRFLTAKILQLQTPQSSSAQETIHFLCATSQRITGWPSQRHGMETFCKFHDPGGRDAVTPSRQLGLDLIHYVTLPGAAWNAMLRHLARELPFTLSPTSRPARTCGPPSWRAELHLSALR